MDEYQERYVAHQERKKNTLALIADRHSERLFSPESVAVEELKAILTAATQAPSSCDRKAVSCLFTSLRRDRSLLSGCLVGGVGWLHQAPLILLFRADMTAYKSEAEKGYMPYLDTGFMAENVYLACTELGLACCFINPNANFPVGKLLDWPDNFLFTGAMAVGHRRSNERTE